MPTINLAEGGGALDLPVAATQFFDATFWITLGAALLVSTAAFVVMRFYVQTIFRESQRSASLRQAGPGGENDTRPPLSAIGPLDIQTEKPGEPTSPPHVRSSTFQHAETAFRRVARIYALGGSVHTIAVDNVGVLCCRLLVVVFLHDGRARPVLGPGPPPPCAPYLGVRGHASSNGRATAACRRSCASLRRRRNDGEGRGSPPTFVRQRGDGAASYRCSSGVLAALTTDSILEPERSPGDNPLSRL